MRTKGRRLTNLYTNGHYASKPEPAARTDISLLSSLKLQNQIHGIVIPITRPVSLYYLTARRTEYSGRLAEMTTNFSVLEAPNRALLLSELQTRPAFARGEKTEWIFVHLFFYYSCYWFPLIFRIFYYQIPLLFRRCLAPLFKLADVCKKKLGGIFFGFSWCG